ncbi:MAG: hypothetical protein CMG76_00085 [Candidatus Marinimicrobia bacterium]|nr:hypothetical protein [Candidatus Neomarinimicrobiota bacterium]|tara:strand:+ start:691 stop:1278 length:588 start_codon:yes stop_codon:yes gene_type:complete
MKFIYLLALCLFASSCSVNDNSGPNLYPDAKQTTINETPEWYLNPPKKDGYSYSTAQATSKDQQIAIDKAVLSAKNTMAANQESEMNGYMKRVQEETGLDESSELLDQFSNTQEQILSFTLKDVRTSKQKVFVEKSDNGKKIYRAYVLIEFDEAARDKRMLDQLERDKDLYDKIRTTDLINEMQEKVDSYRERKN